jgi:predicted permease
MPDLRHAIRSFARQPVFTVVAVATLALGIGVNTAMFSVVYQALLRPLPFPHGDRLASIYNVYMKAGGEPSTVAIPDYLDRRAGATAIEDATLFTPREVALGRDGAPEQITALAVTPSFFTTLERGPALGRSFTDADVAGGVAASVVILTDGLWRSHFGADPAVVGRGIRINGTAHTVVGVLPADFEVPWRDAVALVPFAFTAAQRSDLERGNEFSLMIARLRPGATVAQLDAQLDAVNAAVITRVPDRAEYMRTSGFTGRGELWQAARGRSVRTPLAILQAAVIAVLLIACVNVGNLLLMRTAGRRRELAIRTAIGAGRSRIFRQLLVEGLLLAGAGGIPAIAVGRVGTRLFVRLAAEQLPVSVSSHLDWRMLAFTAVAAGLAGLFCGVLSGLSILRRPPAVLLKDDSARSTGGRRATATRRTLVAAEAAMALVLLVAAGLLVKSLQTLSGSDPGFRADGVLTAQMALPGTRYGAADARRAFWLRLYEKARALPGVRAAGLVSSVPLSGDINAGSYMVTGQPLRPGQQTPHAFQDFVLGDYFRAMHIPILAGRAFNDGDTSTAPRVAIVDERLARRQFGTSTVVGRQLNFGSPRNYTIVGVVGTVDGDDLARPSAEGRIYLNAAQVTPSKMSVVLEAATDPRALAPALRTSVASIDPEQPVARIRTMDEWIDHALQPRRTPAVVLSLFGGAALLLAAIGLYGVLAFAVAERGREFGVRQALGARRSAIFLLVLKDGLMTTIAGLLVGVGASFAVTGYLRSELFGVGPGDPAVMSYAVIGLLAVGGLACYVPARRATRVDPIEAMRID